jgi:hypothetical protein
VYTETWHLEKEGVICECYVRARAPPPSPPPPPLPPPPVLGAVLKIIYNFCMELNPCQLCTRKLNSFSKKRKKYIKNSTPTVGTSRLLDEDRPSKKHPKLSILAQTFSQNVWAKMFIISVAGRDSTVRQFCMHENFPRFDLERVEYPYPVIKEWARICRFDQKPEAEQWRYPDPLKNKLMRRGWKSCRNRIQYNTVSRKIDIFAFLSYTNNNNLATKRLQWLNW